MASLGADLAQRCLIHGVDGLEGSRGLVENLLGRAPLDDIWKRERDSRVSTKKPGLGMVVEKTEISPSTVKFPVGGTEHWKS